MSEQPPKHNRMGRQKEIPVGRLYPCRYVVKRNNSYDKDRPCGALSANRFYCPFHHKAVSDGSDPDGTDLSRLEATRAGSRGRALRFVGRRAER